MKKEDHINRIQGAAKTMQQFTGRDTKACKIDILIAEVAEVRAILDDAIGEAEPEDEAGE